MVKFRRQTSKPAASSAPPRRATAPRKKNPILAYLHTRVNMTFNTHSRVYKLSTTPSLEAVQGAYYFSTLCGQTIGG